MNNSKLEPILLGDKVNPKGAKLLFPKTRGPNQLQNTECRASTHVDMVDKPSAQWDFEVCVMYIHAKSGEPFNQALQECWRSSRALRKLIFVVLIV